MAKIEKMYRVIDINQDIFKKSETLSASGCIGQKTKIVTNCLNNTIY